MITLSAREIEKSNDCRYVTVAEGRQLNGLRHEQNALNYLKRGLIRHALGSMRKARRNYALARLLGWR